MGYLSKHLRTYLKSDYLSKQTPVKVVVQLSKAPEATFSRVPRTMKVRGAALEVLRETGMRGNILRSSTFQPRRIVEGVSTVTLQVHAGELKQLSASPGVEYVRLLRMHRMHLNVSTGLLGLDASVRSRYNGTGVRVAVIDSGIDHNHPDLRGRVNKRLSRNFTDEGSATDVTDGHGHGTHVAGIIGGDGDTYRGVAPGVEFIACKVFDSSGYPTEEGAVIAAVHWAIEKGAHIINYSGGYAPILNHPILGLMILVEPPWVWPKDLLEEEVEFERAMDNGIVAVVSAGNEGDIGRRGTLSMPATSPAVISVGSVDKKRNLSGFSSVGPAYRSERISPADAPQNLTPALRKYSRSLNTVDLVAPGGEVDLIAAKSGGCYYLPGIISALSSTGDKEKAQPCIVNKRYVRGSGTSQSAPHISGLSALILHASRDMNINMGPRSAYVVKGILRAAAQRLDSYRPIEQGRGFPDWNTIEQILKDISTGSVRVGRFFR